MAGWKITIFNGTSSFMVVVPLSFVRFRDPVYLHESHNLKGLPGHIEIGHSVKVLDLLVSGKNWL